MSAFYVRDDDAHEPSIWHRFLYRDDELIVRQCDLPAKNRDSLWRALVRGYGCEAGS